MKNLELKLATLLNFSGVALLSISGYMLFTLIVGA